MRDRNAMGKVIQGDRLARLASAVLVCLSAFACGSTREAPLDPLDREPSAIRESLDHSLTPGQTWRITGTGERRATPGRTLAPALGVAPHDAAVVVEGARDLVIDLSGVHLAGAPDTTPLDELLGYGIVLIDCEHVTVRGARVSGYKVCVAAFHCRDLVLEDIAFEGWFAERLHSTADAEDERDWLRPHENDHGEWRAQYGAAIALEDCTETRIRNCRGRHGQNGILLVRSHDALLVDNDFSFLSGWGLALYRATGNRVAHCVFDYCVRGYSHDVYWRGQDSAGILVFERSSDNWFVENSATHCGDGVFLYGGQDVVEGRAAARGESNVGGSDRNIFYRNDFSYAVANSIEATFSSDNWAIENRLNGARQHGVWGGYSTRLVCLWNQIDHTRGGAVSIEHGVDCSIVGNQIEDADVGLELWWDPDPEFVDGPFGASHDTDSRGAWVSENRFADNAKDIDISRTSDVVFDRNVFVSKPFSLTLTGVVVGGANPKRLEPRALIEGRAASFPSGRIDDVSFVEIPAHEPESLTRARAWRPPSLSGSSWKYADPPQPNQGLATIVMGEFGPWDHRAGEPRPVKRRAGGLLADARFTGAWFAWDAATDPRADINAWRALAAQPLHSGEVGNLTDPYGGSPVVRERVPAQRLGLIASTTIEIAEAGRYRLAVTSDDGVRVVVDGNVVLENWTWHAATRDVRDISLARGRHEIVIEYFQIDGARALIVELERSSGP